ncbi:MAG: phosphotyrosine protein phosphatase [Gammaproteobacteria bacterium]|nr:MAG: phosphotyrosine protein phosphatase [Gammaproteobacteria bacterium]
MNSSKTIYQRCVIDRYGTRRGFVKTFWHKFLSLIGYYRKYSKVDWRSVDRLVFVCKGNICRSAYAEAIAKSLGIDAISCGVSTKDNLPANEEAIKIAGDRGVSLKEHKTTRLTSVTLRPTDLLIAMEPWHAEFLYDNLEIGHSITLLGLWGLSKRPHLADPYGRTAEYFNNCFEYIEKSVNEIEKKIKRH